MDTMAPDISTFIREHLDADDQGTPSLLRRLFEKHQPLDVWPCCPECGSVTEPACSGCNSPWPWPCDTVRFVAEQLGFNS